MNSLVEVMANGWNDGPGVAPRGAAFNPSWLPTVAVHSEPPAGRVSRRGGIGSLTLRAATQLFRAMFLLVLICQCGCGNPGTGLLDVFQTDALLRAAGASQGAVIQKTGKIDDLSSSSNPAMQIGCYSDFEIQLTSGSCGQFLTNYQAEVIKTLTKKGASIVRYEAPPAGLDAEEGIFRYLFATPQRQGIVRVVWGTHAPNHYEMIVMFSEGRK